MVFQYEEKERLSMELVIACKDLKKSDEDLKAYTIGLEEMIFITSHKVRQPVAHILGLSGLLDQSIDYSINELKNIVGYFKKSATTLDNFTKELTLFRI